jgi:hypothetical protein
MPTFKIETTVQLHRTYTVSAATAEAAQEIVNADTLTHEEEVSEEIDSCEPASEAEAA